MPLEHRRSMPSRVGHRLIVEYRQSSQGRGTAPPRQQPLNFIPIITLSFTTEVLSWHLSRRRGLTKSITCPRTTKGALSQTAAAGPTFTLGLVSEAGNTKCCLSKIKWRYSRHPALELQRIEYWTTDLAYTINCRDRRGGADR